MLIKYGYGIGIAKPYLHLDAFSASVVLLGSGLVAVLVCHPEGSGPLCICGSVGGQVSYYWDILK